MNELPLPNEGESINDYADRMIQEGHIHSDNRPHALEEYFRHKLYASTNP